MDNEQVRAEFKAQGLSDEQIDKLIETLANGKSQEERDHEAAINLYNRMMNIGDNGWASAETHRKQKGGVYDGN
jgi:hypothetical protein